MQRGQRTNKRKGMKFYRVNMVEEDKQQKKKELLRQQGGKWRADGGLCYKEKEWLMLQGGARSGSEREAKDCGEQCRERLGMEGEGRDNVDKELRRSRDGGFTV